MRSSGTAVVRVFAPGAIGYIGDPSLLPTVEPYTRHPDVEIRALAPQAIRRLRWESVGKFTDGALAAAGLADQRQHLPGLDGEGHVIENIPVGIWIAETDMTVFDATTCALGNVFA